MAWQRAETVDLLIFRPESSDHRPKTQARLVYDDAGLYCMFRVVDRYVRSVQTEFMGPVCADSCVEFFVRPKPDRGYFNIEINCGGTLLCHYITGAIRTPEGFQGSTPLAPEDGRMIRIQHSMPRTVEPEIVTPTTWTIAYHVPFALLEKYAGPIGAVAGQRWTGNFYKCGDKTSHPHWTSWNPVDALNFHLPQCFGVLEFGEVIPPVPGGLSCSSPPGSEEDEQTQ
jgi:hypothetical protein